MPIDEPRLTGDKKTARAPEGGSGGGWAYLTLTWAVVVLTFWLLSNSAFLAPDQETISYSEFRTAVTNGQVESCTIGPEEIRGVRRSADISDAYDSNAKAPVSSATGKSRAFRTIRVEDPALMDALRSAGVEVVGTKSSPWPATLAWILPLGLVLLFWGFLLRRGLSSLGQAGMPFSKSPARLVEDEKVQVSFRDVAGCEEAKQDLGEVVEFLQNPDRFTQLGAKIPKGILLVGPPGTGKTLLARAVAGESDVPFFTLSGSDFVEMFVGVGAARVRDLFKQAKEKAPCIVFIDELDAVGRARGIRVGNINDEREHTLNQLLVELDGFEPNAGVILLAATNRPDVLDPALLRPGRFDRQVVLDSPDLEGRVAILKIHARGKPLAEKADLGELARATPGFSGADLANTMNEAALAAARAGQLEITQADLEAAVEKVIAGPERKSRRLSPDEKRRVAYHEAGHAIVAAHCKHADPVRKISIIPRGRAALGYTLQLPTGDQHLFTRSALFDRIRSLLGGRAAEELVLEEVSTGAENDLEAATALARSIVGRFGMSDSERLLHCAPSEAEIRIPGILGGAGARNCSEQTASLIDEEAEQLLRDLYQEDQQLLERNRDQLERVANALLEKESLDEADFRSLLLVPPVLQFVRPPSSLPSNAASESKSGPAPTDSERHSACPT